MYKVTPPLKVKDALADGALFLCLLLLEQFPVQGELHLDLSHLGFPGPPLALPLLGGGTAQGGRRAKGGQILVTNSIQLQFAFSQSRIGVEK